MNGQGQLLGDREAELTARREQMRDEQAVSAYSQQLSERLLSVAPKGSRYTVVVRKDQERQLFFPAVKLLAHGIDTETEYHHEFFSSGEYRSLIELGETLNNLIEDSDLASSSLEDIVVTAAKDPAKAGIFNNAGQHWNHVLFWQIMKKGGGGAPGGELGKRIDDAFGSLEGFKEKFKTAAVTQFGSGWAWLALDGDTLKVTKTPNAGNPLVDSMVPLLGIDVWEHAYYLDYENRRPEYVAAFLNHLVDWEQVEANLQAAL